MPSRPQAANVLPLFRAQHALAKRPLPTVPSIIRDIAEGIRRLLESVKLRDFLDVSPFADLPPAIEARRIEEEARIRALLDRQLTLRLPLTALQQAVQKGRITEKAFFPRQRKLITDIGIGVDEFFALDEALVGPIKLKVLGDEAAEALIQQLDTLRSRTLIRMGIYVRSIFEIPFEIERTTALRLAREEAIEKYLTFRQGLFRFVR